MPNHVKHFSINADNVARARKFYESTMGWKFTPWGPPNFFLVATGPEGETTLSGGLQERREIVKGKPIFGFECTLGVENIDKTTSTIEANGGKIVMPKFEIPTVGTLIYFEDTEGNIVGAMQYENRH